MDYKLTFLFDGACPLCLREVSFLKKRNKANDINFVDISLSDYKPEDFNNINYIDAMDNLHGILENGEIIKGLDVLSYSYELIGLGWVYYPIKLPYISNLLRLIYRFWAKNRLLITGRSNEEKICSTNCIQIK